MFVAKTHMAAALLLLSLLIVLPGCGGEDKASPGAEQAAKEEPVAAPKDSYNAMMALSAEEFDAKLQSMTTAEVAAFRDVIDKRVNPENASNEERRRRNKTRSVWMNKDYADFQKKAEELEKAEAAGGK